MYESLVKGNSFVTLAIVNFFPWGVLQLALSVFLNLPKVAQLPFITFSISQALLIAFIIKRFIPTHKARKIAYRTQLILLFFIYLLTLGMKEIGYIKHEIGGYIFLFSLVNPINLIQFLSNFWILKNFSPNERNTLF